MDDSPAGSTGASASEAESVPTATRREYRGTGIIWALVATATAGLILLVLIVQNTETVVVHFLWFTWSVSLVVLVLATILLTVCVAESIGLVWRHRRRQQLTNRDELRRIHDAAA